MIGIARSNCDVDIHLSEEEIACGSKCSGREFPILEGELVDEQGTRVGRIKVQKTATTPCGQVRGDRDVYFLSTGPEEWFVQLGFEAYHELREHGSVMRRIPFCGAQLYICNPQSN